MESRDRGLTPIYNGELWPKKLSGLSAGGARREPNERTGRLLLVTWQGACEGEEARCSQRSGASSSRSSAAQRRGRSRRRFSPLRQPALHRLRLTPAVRSRSWCRTRPAARPMRSRASSRTACPGVGSFGHWAGVLVAEESGASVTHVPYRGAGPALNDLLAGVADLSSISAVVAGPLVKAGKIKAYAIIGRTRFAGLPELPTMGEVGYKKLDLDFWHMLLAPAGTPRPIVERLNAALRHALADGRVRKTFDEGGMDVFAADQQTPEAAGALLKRELKLWAEVIRANNIAAQ